MMLFIATLLVYLAGIVMGLAIHSHMDDLQTPASSHSSRWPQPQGDSDA
jgi:hypothetical protein